MQENIGARPVDVKPSQKSVAARHRKKPEHAYSTYNATFHTSPSP